MRKLIVLFVVSVSLALGIDTACRADEAPAAEALQKIEPAEVKLDGPVDFERDIYPILEANCIACHNLAIHENDLVLEDVPSMLKGGSRGAAIVAQKPDESLIYQVASRGVEPAMPPLPNESEAKALTPEQLGLLRQWIIEGAQQGTGGTGDKVAWQPLPAGLHAIYSVALAPSGRFAAAGRVNQIEVVDPVSGQRLARLVDPALADLQHEGHPMYPAGAAHRDFVNSLAFSPDGDWLASGGYRVVKLWQRLRNVQRGRQELAAPVSALAVSADGTRLAAGLADNSVQVVNRANPQEVLNLVGHTAPVTDVEFWPDGSKLISVSTDQTIRVWNPADGAAIAQIATPAPIAAAVVQSDTGRIVTAHADNRIRVWDLPAAGAETTAPVLEIAGHEKPVTALAILSTGATQLVSGSEDGTVRIWNLADGQAVQTLAHGAPVTSVALRVDGLVVASAGANGIAKLWQAADGKQLAEFKGDVYRDLALTDATDNQNVAKQLVTVAQAALDTAQKGVTEREDGLKKAQEAKTQSDTALTEAQTKQQTEQTNLDAAKAELAAKPEDEELKKKVAEAEKTLQAAVDAVKKATETQLSAQRAVELGEKALAASKQSVEERTSQKTAAEEQQKQVDAALAEIQQQAQGAVQPIRAIAFSADGKQLATAGDDQTVHLWDGNTGRCLETFAGHSGAIAATAFASDGALLSAGADKSVIAWETLPGWRLAGQLGPAADAPLEFGPSPLIGRVLALAFSPDGKLLATGGGEASRAGELLLWDVATRSVARTFTEAHSDTVLGLEFSRDGKFLLSGAADKFVKIFDVASGNHVRSFEGHTHHVLDVSWKADATAIATAGADDQIKVWTVETGEQQRTIGGYTKQVTSIQYIGIGDQIVSSGGDKTVRLHTTGNGKQERAFGGATDFVYTSAVTRDGGLVIAGGEDGVLRGWNGVDAKSLWNLEPPAPATADNTQASAQ